MIFENFDLKEELRKMYDTKINKLLKEIYNRLKISENEYLINIENISGPFLMSCNNDEYIKSKYKIMVVGQQTNGWLNLKNIYGNPDPTTTLMEKYEELNIITYGSPFGRFCKKINEKLNGKENKYGLQWNNIWKFDQYCNKCDLFLEECQIRWFNVLQDEISILNPDIIIFCMTQKYLDKNLSRILKKYDCKENIHEEKLSRLNLTKTGINKSKIFRINHPKYLSHQKDIDNIVEIIAKNIHNN